MKHFANFNNIGLGVGAAVGLARGSGLIGESQEERDNTTGLGRLGKLAGYTGGGAALGAGAGKALKYARGSGRNAVETPPSQHRRERVEPPSNRQDAPPTVNPPQSEGRRKAAEVQAKIDKLKQEGQEAVNAANSWANPRPEPVTSPPDKRAMGVSARVTQKKAANTSPYAPPQSNAATIGGRAATWNGAGYKQHRTEIQTKINEIKASALPEEQKKYNIKVLLKELEYKTLNNPVLVGGESVQDLINAGNYSKSQNKFRSF